MFPLDRYTCEDVFRRLDDFVDRELSEREMALVQEHLDICARCAREYHFETGVIQQVRAKVGRLVVPGDLLGRISSLLGEEAGPPGDGNGGGGSPP